MLLLRAGAVIRSEAQRDLLLERQGGPGAAESSDDAADDDGPEPIPDFPGTAATDPAAPDGPATGGSAFPRLRTPVEAAQLTLTIAGARRKVPVEYVGVLGRESVVLGAPAWHGQPFLPQRGAPVSVRLFAGRGIHLFDSTVVAVASRPLAHLHVAVPAQCSTMEFRRHPRVRVDLPVIVHRGNLPTVGATLDNVSAGGCRIGAPEPLGEVDDRVAVSFTLRVDGSDAPLRIAAIVRNREGPHARGGWRTGLEFVQLSAGDRLALYSFVQAELYRD